MKTGRIKFYNGEKKFGFIIEENQSEIFFHVSGISPAYTPQAGDKVSYDVENGKKGPNAVNICQDE